MKYLSIILFGLLATAAVGFPLSGTVTGQTPVEGAVRELRPFDFSDEFYRAHGIYSDLMIERRNGADGLSVFDNTPDPDRRDVRITATKPAYSSDGAPLFWNPYGRTDKGAFTRGGAGDEARNLAERYQMLVFPSTLNARSERQAAIILTDQDYFSKNELGIAAVYYVMYTEQINTPEGRTAMRILAGRNGVSLDGTPIIKTKSEIDELLTKGLITMSRTGGRGRSGNYVIGRILEYADRGALAADAYLVHVQGNDGGPLEAERHFVDRFECLQNGGTLCM